METILKLLENESELHFYLRKCTKYLIILLVSFIIYSKLGGDISFYKVFNNDNGSINFQHLLEELLSSKTIIPLLFIFIAYSIFSLFEFGTRLLFYGLTQVCAEKGFEESYLQLEKTKNSIDIGLEGLKEMIVSSIKKIPILDKIVKDELKKEIDEVSNFKNSKELKAWHQKIEEVFLERLDEFVEMSIIGFLMFFLINTEILDFLYKHTFLYWFCWILLLLFPISRLLLIIIITWYFRFSKLLVAGGEKYFELKEKESNTSNI